MTESPGLIERRQRLDEVIGAYLEAADAGQAPDPGAWLASHPELRGELAEFLADQARIHRIVPPIRSPSRHPLGVDATVTGVHAGLGSPGTGPEGTIAPGDSARTLADPVPDIEATPLDGERPRDF